MCEFNVTQVNGDYGETFVGISSNQGSSGTMEQVVSVADGTEYLSVTLIESLEKMGKPEGVQLRVTSPDGNSVPVASEITKAGYYLIVAEQPMPGDWTLEVEASGASEFQAEARALPRFDIDASRQANEEQSLRWASLEKFGAQLPGYDQIVELLASEGVDGGCQACRIAMSAVLVVVGMVVLLIAFGLGLISAKFPPLLIIFAAVGAIGVTITAHALASLVVSIIGGGNRTVDTVADRLCVAFKICPPR